MTPQTLRELAETRRQLAELEKIVAREQDRALAALPAHYGFESVADFSAAVTRACATHGVRAYKVRAKRRRTAKPVPVEATPVAATAPEPPANPSTVIEAITPHPSPELAAG